MHVTNTPTNAPTNDKELQEWGRHYDRLYWEVTALFSAALSGLLTFVYTYAINKIEIEIFGFLLTFLAIYFASSFREIRNNFQKGYPKNILEIFGKRRFWQGRLYYGLFWLLGVLWVFRIFMAAQGKNIIPISVDLSSMGFFVTINLIWFAVVFWFYHTTSFRETSDK